MALDVIHEFLADGIVAGGPDANGDGADLIAALRDVNRHILTLGRLGSDFPVHLRTGAVDVDQLQIFTGLVGRRRHLVRSGGYVGTVAAKRIRSTGLAGRASVEDQQRNSHRINRD